MEKSLNSFIQPYDAAGAIQGLNTKTPAGGGGASLNLDPGVITPNQDTINRHGLAPKDLPNVTVEWKRTNAVGSLGQIDLNYDQTVSHDSNLNDILDKRQGILDQSDLTFRQMQDRAFGQEKVMQDLPRNGIGRLALLNRLEEQFGRDWRNVPAAQNLLSQFDANIGQEQDIGSLNEFLEQGKQVADFISSPGQAAKFQEIIKLGDKILGTSDLMGNQSYSDRYGKSETEWKSFLFGGGL